MVLAAQPHRTRARRWAVFAVAALALVLLSAPSAHAEVAFAPQEIYPAGPGPDAMVVGDFNGDGDPDLAVGDRGSGTVSVLVGGSGGSFGAPTSYPVGPDPVSIAVGDFNRDGDRDLAVANFRGDTVSVLLGGAGSSFGAATTYPVGGVPNSVAAGDFNQDGDLDLLVT